MKIVQGVFYFLLIMIAALLLAALVAPSSKVVSRSIVINDSPSLVFRQILDFEKWENWDPWFSEESGHLRTYVGSAGDMKQSFSWTADDESSGKVVQKDVRSDEYLSFSLEKEGLKSSGSFILKEVGQNTEVTWSLTSEMGYPRKLLNYFMERWVGPDFEKGLKSLKTYVETQSEEEQTKTSQIRRETIHGKSYVLISNSRVQQSEVGDFLKINTPKVEAYIQTNGLVARGAAKGVYYGDVSTGGHLAVAAAVPLDAWGYSEDSVSLTSGRGLLTKDYIAYSLNSKTTNLDQAKYVLNDWLAINEKQLKYPILTEQYFLDGKISDTASQKTKVFLFYE